MARGGVFWIVVLVAVGVGGCGGTSSSGEGRIGVVTGVYPLAWAARVVGGGEVAVHDLTPRGGEAHDLQLTARQRSVIAGAAVVLIVGEGFQPEVERAAADGGVRVVDVTKGLALREAREEGLKNDPHVWLDPVAMQRVLGTVADALGRVKASARAAFEERAEAAARDLATLDTAFREGLAGCEVRTVVTTHEAFSYLAARYGLVELGLTGVTPESEPAAAQIQRVREMAAQKKVFAIFFEATDEGRRAGASVARDTGVKALPLHTLESDPAPRDYVGQMRENLARLREGLKCA